MSLDASTTQRCYIGLGSNLDDPLSQLRAATAQLAAHDHIELIQTSSIYESKAIGPGEQPNYLNAVAELDCRLSPKYLLKALQSIELQQGRQRNVRWEARTLDLDILLYANDTISSDILTIPHPEMINRNFVIYPLYELKPTLALPDGQSLQSIYDQLKDEGLKRLYNVALYELK